MVDSLGLETSSSSVRGRSVREARLDDGVETDRMLTLRAVNGDIGGRVSCSSSSHISCDSVLALRLDFFTFRVS